MRRCCARFEAGILTERASEGHNSLQFLGHIGERAMRFRLAFLIFFLLSVVCKGNTWAATYAIVSLNLDGSDVKVIAQDPEWNYGSASVSHDGKRIAFDAWPVPEFSSLKQWICVADINGKGMKKVIKGAMPKWSPDDTLIAFQDYVNGVAVSQLDGTGKEVVYQGCGNPNWIQNGNGLVVLEWGRNLKLVSLIDGSAPGITNGVAISRDATKVSFCQRVGNSDTLFELVVASLDGKTFPKAHRRGELCTGFGWHPDGKRIVFCEGAKGSQLFILNIDTGKILAVPGDKNQSYVNSSFSPDGKRIICSSTIRLEKRTETRPAADAGVSGE
jgi:Tol biopolymer transport system component